MNSDLYSSTHTTLERMTRIHQRLNSGGQFPNSTLLAEILEVSSKTIQRDIKFMKECWNLPIIFNKSMGGYEYTEEVMDFPAIKLTEEEVFAFLIARNSIEKYQGTHLLEPLSRLYEKIIVQMGFKQSTRMKRIKEYISFRPAGWTKAKYRVLDKLSKACRDRREISFTYDYPSKREEKRKRIKPIQLINHDNAWYLLVGNDQNKPGHFYSLARISNLKLHAPTFTPIIFSIEKFMKDNFGIFKGDKIYDIKITFDSFAAPYIKERKRNGSQKIKDRTDGGIDFSITVNHLIEIKAWIMSWGRHATVIEPRELVLDLKDELTSTLKKYPKT
jgi:proteasome accessory factor B